MQKNKTTAKQLVMVALFTAIIMLATWIIQIPLPFGYVNLGDGFIFLAAFILGSFWGAVAAGVGAAMADVFAGYALYAPATFAIKALMAVLAWFTYKACKKVVKNSIVSEIIAGVAGALLMAFGYFVYEWILYTAAAAIVNIPWNLLQGGVGTMVCVIIMRFLRTRDTKHHTD